MLAEWLLVILTFALLLVSIGLVVATVGLIFATAMLAQKGGIYRWVARYIDMPLEKFMVNTQMATQDSRIDRWFQTKATRYVKKHTLVP